MLYVAWRGRFTISFVFRPGRSPEAATNVLPRWNAILCVHAWAYRMCALGKCSACIAKNINVYLKNSYKREKSLMRRHQLYRVEVYFVHGQAYGNT